MNDIREDMKLCGSCYIPTNYLGFNTYYCSNCNNTMENHELVRSSELQRRIEEGLEIKITKKEVNQNGI